MTFPWHVEALNPPFADPGFFLQHRYNGQALFFDLGDLQRLSARQILKADQIFISHAHIDHLIGFDQLLRLALNRSKHLHIYGPPGIISQLGHKLQGYTWNLTEHYDLRLTVHEVSPQHINSNDFLCSLKFIPQSNPVSHLYTDHVISQRSEFTVRAVALDHGIESLAYLLEEPQQINFHPDKLLRRNWQAGPWLTRVRRALQDGTSPNTVFEVPGGGFQALETIAGEIATLQTGVKIAYVADILFSEANLEKLLPLIHRADLLLCEAAFLNTASDKAARSFHLTAEQAGLIARMAEVKQLKIFHFSPRHSDQEQQFYAEAAAAFHGPVN
ncbi:MAG: ribonuclease Z [Deltaproteobacteria bacterium]|nr:ribonuclease Z [Deltaproteobacteria bacterium]